MRKLLILLFLVGCANTYTIDTEDIESIRAYFRRIIPSDYVLTEPTDNDYKICKNKFNSEPIYYVRRKNKVFGNTRCMVNEAFSIERANRVCKYLGKDWKLLSFDKGKIICEQKRNF